MFSYTNPQARVKEASVDEDPGDEEEYVKNKDEVVVQSKVVKRKQNPTEKPRKKENAKNVYKRRVATYKKKKET